MKQQKKITTQRDQLAETVNELKTTQQQLIQSEKLASLGEVTAGIAHEIQNPLNFVNNFSEVCTELIDEMEQELTKGDESEAIIIASNIKQNLKKILEHGKRADGIVKNMLLHSRSNSGEKQPIDINVLTDEYLRLSYHGLRAKNKSFNSAMTTIYDQGIPKLNIIPQDIGRVLLNLFNNAFYAVQQKQKTEGSQYTPEVRVSTTLNRQFAEVRVWDNGTGIPKALIDKILQPFFTTKPTGEGTGLGLSLSRDILVKGHGGKIDIHSKEGEYTEFIISIPV
jgi:two-component system NtrC family sensor kinase